MGRKQLEKTKKKISNARKKEWREGKRKPLMLGKHHSEETRKKMSDWHKGKRLSEKHKKRLSEVRKSKRHWNWQGGKSFEPYSIDWNESLRRAIRERDKYICQLCGKIQGDIAHDVHHINYNKQNCNPDNLITLCHSCNTKVNKHRKYWVDYFNRKIWDKN